MPLNIVDFSNGGRCVCLKWRQTVVKFRAIAQSVFGSTTRGVRPAWRVRIRRRRWSAGTRPSDELSAVRWNGVLIRMPAPPIASMALAMRSATVSGEPAKSTADRMAPSCRHSGQCGVPVDAHLHYSVDFGRDVPNLRTLHGTLGSYGLVRWCAECRRQRAIGLTGHERYSHVRYRWSTNIAAQPAACTFSVTTRVRYNEGAR
jgi:hypothetical protein